MEKTWIVMCPNWKSTNHENKAHGWALFRNALKRIGNDYFDAKIECIVCRNKFSLQQGVNEAFSSDVAINHFRYNSNEHGEIEVDVGHLSRVRFREPFVDAPEVNLTPYQPVNAVPGYVTNSEFAIFSCSKNGGENEKRRMSWHASGNRATEPVPLWRGLLSNAKEHQKRKNFRSEIVELESAFEVFIGEYLSKHLIAKVRQETLEWILKKSIEEQLYIGFTELAGQPLSKMRPKEYKKWQELVKEKRDHIVHRGLQVTPEQAKNARKALFDLLTRVDSSSMEHFQIQMKDIGSDGPHMSFGTATIKGKTTPMKT